MAHPIIQRGDTGQAVKDAQQALLDRGYLPDPTFVDGKFGNHTYAAVIRYQHEREAGEFFALSWPLKVDGIVGVSTWGRLAPDTIKSGATGASVLLLQYLLTITGNPPWDPGPLDGNFGPLTEAAVKTYQTDMGLTSNGIVDAKTWTALFS
jgi:peptidoglycan hydrolase-like protein with peptidoglycan-binding domain